MIKLLLKKENKFLTDTLYSVVLGGISGLIAFGINILLANEFSEQNFAVYSIAISIIYIFNVPAQAIQNEITKVVSESSKENLNSFYSNNLKKFYLLAIGLGLFSLLFLPILKELKDVKFKYGILISLAIFGSILTPYLKGFLIGLQRIKRYNWLNFTEFALRLILVLVAIYFYLTPTLPMLSFSIPMLLMTAFFHKNIKKILSKQKTDQSQQEQPKFSFKSLYLVIGLIFLYNLGYTLDIQIIDNSLTSQYSALTLIGKVVYFSSILGSTTLIPYVAKSKIQEQQQKYLYFSLALTMSIGLIVAFTLYITRDIFAANLIPKYYSDIQSYILPTTIYMAFFSSTFILVNYAIAKKYFKVGYIFIITRLIQVATLYIFNQDLENFVKAQAIILIIEFIIVLSYLLHKDRI